MNEDKNKKVEMTPLQRMFKLAEWNKGLARKKVYSAECDKVVNRFDNDKKIINENLIPSLDQNYLIRKLKAVRRTKNWVEWRCDMCQIL